MLKILRSLGKERKTQKLAVLIRQGKSSHMAQLNWDPQNESPRVPRPILVTAHVSHKTRNPRKNKVAQKFRSEKLQNESFPNFSIFRPEFCPEFCSEFSPNVFWSFRASFGGRRRPEKIHQKSPPFFNAKFPGKFEEKIHRMFLERSK